MDIKSLRKGSVVKYDKKTAYIAQVLMDVGVVIYDGYGLEKMTTSDCLRGHGISEENFLKMGFKFKNIDGLVFYEKSWQDYTIEIQLRATLPKFTFWINGVNIKYFNYLHELQGLYFEVTCEFLTI
jgi:hypothetical protein